MDEEREKLIRDAQAALENGFRRGADRIILFPRIVEELIKTSKALDDYEKKLPDLRQSRYDLNQKIMVFQSLIYEAQRETMQFQTGERLKKKFNQALREIRDILNKIANGEMK